MPAPAFSFTYRNPGHWDIASDEGRLKIRGVPGDVTVMDERKGRFDSPVRQFRTVLAAMTWCCDELARGAPEEMEP